MSKTIAPVKATLLYFSVFDDDGVIVTGKNETHFTITFIKNKAVITPHGLKIYEIGTLTGRYHVTNQGSDAAWVPLDGDDIYLIVSYTAAPDEKVFEYLFTDDVKAPDISTLALEANVEGHVTTATALLAVEANVEGHATDALNSYDPPTKDELDSAVSPLAIEANVEGHATDALNAYDPPTKDEMDSAIGAIVVDNEAIADAVWDELIASHLGGDKAGQHLSDAAAGAVDVGAIADAVWDEAIASHAVATTFGGKNQRVVPSETLADYKADVSALALEAGIQGHAAAALNAYDPPTKAELDGAVLPLATALSLADVHTDVGSIITGLASLATSSALSIVDTVVDAIKAKTDLLPWDPVGIADLAIIKGLLLANAKITDIVVDTGKKLLSAKLRIYSSSTLATEIGRVAFTASYSGQTLSLLQGIEEVV